MQFGAGKRRNSTLWVARQEAELDCGNHRFDLGARAEPLVEGAHVRADSVDAQVECDTNVLVAVPMREQLQNLELPPRDELVDGRGPVANSRHARGAAPSPTENQLRDRRRHWNAATKQLAKRLGKAEHVLAEQVAASPRLDHRGDALLVDRSRNDEQWSAVSSEKRAHLSDVAERRVTEGNHDGVGAHARQLCPTSGEARREAHLERAIPRQDLLRRASVESDQENPGRGSFEDSRVAAAVHLVSGSYPALRLRPDVRAPQGSVTCFEFNGRRAPEVLAVYRVSSLVNIEFSALHGCSQTRFQLSDAQSASLVLGSGREVCGQLRTRGKQVDFRPGDILLSEAGEIQLTSGLDRPNAFFTISWQPSAFAQTAAESGLSGRTGWKVSELAPGPLSAELEQLYALLESGADAAAVEAAYRSAATGLIGIAGRSDLPATSSVLHRGVRRALKRLGASLAEPLSLAELAIEAQMSKCHLVRCFQQAFGVPPHRYRILLRLQCARRLLESGLSVSEVAERTGFADAPHLTRAFRDWLGVSPAAWGNAWRASEPWSAKRLQTLPPPAV